MKRKLILLAVVLAVILLVMLVGIEEPAGRGGLGQAIEWGWWAQ